MYIIKNYILFEEFHKICGLTPSSQEVGYKLVPPGRQNQLGKQSEHSSNGFDKPRQKVQLKWLVIYSTSLRFKNSMWTHLQ